MLMLFKKFFDQEAARTPLSLKTLKKAQHRVGPILQKTAKALRFYLILLDRKK